jgi:hypothetical protein
MGTLDNGGGGPFGDLPDLPPEWGPIQIPDDASELAEEAAQVRRELREAGDRPRAAHPAEGLRAGAVRTGGASFGLPAHRAPASSRTEPPSLRLPLLIVAAALLAAVASLFAVAWSGARRQAATGQAGDSIVTASQNVRALPAYDLVDESGAPIPVRRLLPAAILLTDGCQCAVEIAAIAAAAPPGVTIVTVSHDPPAGAEPATPVQPTRPVSPAATDTTTATVRRLRDPADQLRTLFSLAPGGGGAPALLIGKTGEVVEVVNDVKATPVAAYASELASLPGR